MAAGNLKRNFMYFPVSKSASTSIYNILYYRYGARIVGSNLFVHIIPDEYKDTFKFTVVRNPYERAVSIWQQLTFNLPKRYNYPQFTNFIKFLQWLSTLKNRLAQVTWSTTKFLENIPIDKIIKLCDLETEFKLLPFYAGEQLDWPVLNKGKLINSNEHLTPQAKELIYRIFTEDFERFGYVK